MKIRNYHMVIQFLMESFILVGKENHRQLCDVGKYMISNSALLRKDSPAWTIVQSPVATVHAMAALPQLQTWCLERIIGSW